MDDKDMDHGENGFDTVVKDQKTMGCYNRAYLS